MKGKLVRDKIPALTVANNQQVYVKILSKEELVSLNQKAYRSFYFRPRYLFKKLFLNS